MIKAGIFDVGNVLIHWNSHHLELDIQRTLGINEEVFRKAWSKFEPRFDRGELSEDEFWQNFIEATNAEGTLPSESLFLREFIKRFEPNIKTMDLIKRLKAVGLKLAVLSNTTAPHVAFLREQGIYRDFDELILSNEVGLRKPDPAIYKTTLERLGVSTNEAFFVDDLQDNVKAAKLVGIHSFLFTNANQLQTDLTQLGVIV